jgi:uncharacterized YigZ family protein
LSASEEILFKEKNSKFFGYAFPITSEEEVKPIIDNLRKKHFNAGHFCYAYQLGTAKTTYRANDDGEPSNSAGMPIFGQIQSYDLTNIIVVVVRFFGGTKLGVGGLISAYKTAAQLALEQAEIVEKTIDIHFKILFDYKNINKVMRIIKEKNLNIISQKMDSNCEIEIATRKSNEKIVYVSFQNLFDVEVKIIE